MPSNNAPHLVNPGDRFGRLLVEGFSHNDKRHRRHYHVLCDCGIRKTVQGTLLRSGNTRSCGCLSREDKANRRISQNHSEVTAIILSYKRHARQRGYEWSLSREEVVEVIGKACHYCGSPPSNIMITKNTITPLAYNGIDRFDNSLGYRADNVVPCCAVCNRGKRDLTVEEFVSWAKRVADRGGQ